MLIYKDMTISAAHRLNLPYESQCNRLHGHNYRVEVWVADTLDSTGIVADFNKIGEAIKRYDHCLLNDLFANPTAEMFAIQLYGDLRRVCPTADTIRVRVWESATCYAEFDNGK